MFPFLQFFNTSEEYKGNVKSMLPCMPNKDRSFRRLFLCQDELSPLTVSKHSAGNNKLIQDKDIQIWSTSCSRSTRSITDTEVVASYYNKLMMWKM